MRDGRTRSRVASAQLPPSGRSIEIPARLAAKLSPEQCMKLENWAHEKHDSRKHLVAIEKLLEQGVPFDEAVQKAGSQ
jgi:hypothetical protein